MSTRSRMLSRLARRLGDARLLGGLGAAGLLACTSACTGGGTSDSTPTVSSAAGEANRQTRPADFTNGGFESGDFTGWTVTTMLNGGVATFPPAQFSDLGLTAGGVNDTTVVSATTAGYPVPVGLTAGDSLKYPYTNNDSAVLNAQGASRNTNVIEQSTTVLATDVDPSDGLVHARFAVAPVLQDPAHNGNQQPYFYLELLNTTTGTQLFHTFNFSNQPGVSWITSTSSTAILYTNWKAFDIAPGSGAIRLGDVIHARVVAAGCALGGHWGEIYLDQFGTTFPRPDVVVTAPAYANAGGTLTYTVTAKNGGNGPATGTVVDFTLPTVADSSNANSASAPNTAATTFASISTSGQTCTTPAVGASGTVVCTIGGLSPSASSTFTVTVNLPNALSMATWTAPINANEGIYDIKTTQNPVPLTGGVVQTQITGLVPVDLKASLTDGVPAITWGSTDSYTYTVTNTSATTAVAAGTKVTDTAPAGFAVSSWSCSATTSSSCGTSSGATGAINTTTGAIAAGGVLTYTINGKWTGTGTTDATYSVTATPPAAYAQAVTFDNVGSDTDRLTSTTFPLTVNKTGNGDGLVVSSPAAIKCDVGCTTQSASYGSGETVALWAIAPNGQTFTGWSGGGCSGITSPCTVVVGAATTVTARFDEPSLVAAVTATTNGTSLTDVRPGDTEDSTVTVTVPDGQNAGLVLADTLPAALTYASATAPVFTGSILCNGGACTAPTTATSGQTTTWDFGVVTCTSASGCTIAETVEGQTATTGASSVRGTVLTSTFAASAAKSATTAVTVDEPNMALSEAASPATGITRGQTTTVTATITNAGVATSGGYDAVASFPTPANTTPQNYKPGTCPAATPSYGGPAATFTFPTSTTSAFPVGTNCTFSYDLLLGSAAPVGQTLAIPGGTLTSASKATAPSKPYSVTAAGTSILTSLLGAGATCASNDDCSDGVCDDGKCGYDTGDGPCTPGADVKCRSGQCSKSGSCEPTGGCLEDADCDTSVNFCNTVTDSCTPKLLNGTPIPSIAGHVPALTGQCTTSNLVGQAVCDTGVCDTDNECGLQIGDGTCTTDAECRAGVCVTTGANAGKCEVCRDDTQCAGNASTKACDTTTNQCVSCTTANATACSGTTAFCNAATDICTGCSGDNGSTATFACPSSAPYCNPDPANGGACTTTCYSDSDCGAGNWCDAGACTAKLPNGSPLPKVAGHTPDLDGSCTVAIANAVCLTDSCDPTLLICGFANGEGPCTDSAQCGNGVCVTSGTNAGKCEPCEHDTTCGGATPVCNTVTNSCAACGLDNSSVCAGVTPVCNTAAFLCVACTGDFGTSTSFACDQANPNCNTETGACGTFCTTDTACGTGRWCDANACTAKLPNGTPIPVVTGHSPDLTGVCTTAIGLDLCLSGICDLKTNVCGISFGDACTSDAQCPTGDTCTGGSCAVGNGSGTGADGGTTGGGMGAGTGTGGGTGGGTEYDVLGGGCTLGPEGAGSSGTELGFLVGLVSLVTRRRRKAAAAAASNQESV